MKASWPSSSITAVGESPATVIASNNELVPEFELPKSSIQADRIKKVFVIKRVPGVHTVRGIKKRFGFKRILGVLLAYHTLSFYGCNQSHWLHCTLVNYASNNIDLLLVIFAGFTAQLVDGSLGMGFGVTSTTLMVGLSGLSPLEATTTVHLAQLGTTFISGLSHYSAGNVHGPTCKYLSFTGAAGAFFGATMLTTLSTQSIAPLCAGILFLMGAYLMVHFTFVTIEKSNLPSQDACRARFLLPLGATGGFIDATGGGGWGPVATTCLLVKGVLAPAKVVGTVSLSEFFTTVGAVAGFYMHMGREASEYRLDLAGALLVGGALAAPIAPYILRSLPQHHFGISLGGFICLTNSRILMSPLHLPKYLKASAYLGMLMIYASMIVRRSSTSSRTSTSCRTVSQSPRSKRGD